MIKQVIVMRKYYPDGKGGQMQLRRGKEISQGAHAAIAWLVQRVKDFNGSQFGSDYVEFSEEELEWITSLQTKICLQVFSEKELMDIYTAAKLYHLEVHLVTDAGLTEFNGVPTKTCLAIGPAESDIIDNITKHLKLY